MRGPSGCAAGDKPGERRRDGGEPASLDAAALGSDMGDPQPRRDRLVRLEGEPGAQRLAPLPVGRDLRGGGRMIGQKGFDGLSALGRQPPLDEGVQVVLADRTIAGHLTLLKTAPEPVSRRRRIAARARLSRDMTVPSGTPRMRAVSA